MQVIAVSEPGALSGASPRERLTALLKEEGSAIIVDRQGEGLPGLEVIDPGQKISWLKEDPLLAQDQDTTRVLLLEGSYCAKRWQENQTCPLLPERSQVAGNAKLPQSRASFQYLYTPSKDKDLVPGRYILTSPSQNLLDSLLLIFGAAGLEIASVQAEPFWLELISNPLFIISSSLLLLGLTCIWVYLKMLHHRSRQAYLVRYYSGATRAGLLWEASRRSAVGIIPSCVGGALLSVPIVHWIARTPLDSQAGLILLLATSLSSLGMLSIYALTLHSYLGTKNKRLWHAL